MNAVRVAVSGEASLVSKVRALAERLGLPLGTDAELLLYLTPERLELRETSAYAAGPVYADFVGGRADYRRKHGGGRGQALARAIGLKGGAPPRVVDATAGLGQDAFVLASLGAEVVMLERSPVVAALLEDALRRARENVEVASIAARMALYVGEAQVYLQRLAHPPEVVYLDPMYPHSGKNALPKKEMRLFRQLVGRDDDAAELLEVAQQVGSRRVVVKRPLSATTLAGEPDGKILSKNTRYDLYLRGGVH